MTEVPNYPDANGNDFPRANVAPNIIVHALRENKRPIGFAAWPEEEPKPKRPRKERSKKSA